MEKSKYTFSGETLELLKKLSPKIRALAGDKTSVEIKADDLFKYVKKGKSVKEKFFLFVKALQLDEGQPLFLKKKFAVDVRPNWSSKSEIEEILKEAGISDSKIIFQRAKNFVEGKLKETTAETKPHAKGKAEHASQFRGARSMRGRYHGEGAPEGENDFFEEMSPEQAWYEASMREPTREEKERHAKWVEFAKERQRFQEEMLRSHHVNAPRAWAEKFPGKRYPPEDPGWQWAYPPGEWRYFSAPGANPFYNDEFMFGRREKPYVAPEGKKSNEAPPPPPPRRAEPGAGLSCEAFLLSQGIKNKITFYKWVLRNHPDKVQQTSQEEGLEKANADKKIETATALFKRAWSCMEQIKESQNKGDDWHIGPSGGFTRKHKYKGKKNRTHRV
jgi:hypothetical protein